MQKSQKYGIYPENVTVKQQQIYMKFGNVSACLGSQVSGEQIAQIKPILKSLVIKRNPAFGDLFRE